MNKTRLTMMVLAAMLLAASCGYAQTPGQGNLDKAGKGKEAIYKELNLTPQQQQQLEENRKAQHQKMSQLRSAIGEKEKQLQQALKDPEVTTAKVEPLVSEIKALQGQLIDQRVSGIFAVKGILSPEQIAQLNQLMEKRKEGRQDRLQEWRKKRQGTASAVTDK